MCELSIIIPTVNSSHYIFSTLERIRNTLLNRSLSFEMIIVIDGENQSVLDEVIRFKKQYSQSAKIICFQKNHGQKLAVLAGLENASGNFLVTTDDDLQYNPEDIFRLYDTVVSQPKTQIVCGFASTRNDNKNYIFYFRNILFLLLRLFFPSFLNTGYFTPFKLFRRSLLFENNKWLKIQVYHFWTLNPNEIKKISVDHYPKKVGNSNYNMIMYFTFFNHILLKLISRFSFFCLLFLFLFYLMFKDKSYLYSMILSFFFFLLSEVFLFFIKSKKAIISKVLT